MFAYVESGSLVQFFAKLPFTFKGVSRVPSLTVAEQAALGLLPVIDVTPPFDSETTRLVAEVRPDITIFADRVEITRPTEAIPAEEIAERNRLVTIDNSIRGVTLGTTTPKTRAELKAMTVAEYNDWFNLNFDTAAKLIALLKLILLAFIRRVL